MITTTVYSLIYPETKALLEEMWDAHLHEMYGYAWLKRQDNSHLTFFNTWKQWVQDVVHVPTTFTHMYPTAGSSEAIRASISEFASRDDHGVIHIFTGEYEGYRAFAQPLGVTVVEHDRYGDWKKSLKDQDTGNDLFFISQPSSLDGNIWSGYNDFALYLQKEHSSMKIMLDLCYVGTTVHNNYDITITDNVDMIFFSLSKVFGVYYHRIGGVFSRNKMPTLFGNIWFKNLFSLAFGEELMKRHKLGELPSKYKYVRDHYLSKELAGSDVFMLATKKTNCETKFTRFQAKDKFHNRYCLTAEIQTELLGEKK